MKRALSILLAALLLLVAVPTVAEDEALKAGLYISEAETELMYLNDEGVGVLNYISDQYYANGVVWTESSLEIERTAVPYTLADGVLTFTYDGIEMALRYEGDGEAFALGDQGEMAFAGEYVAENGDTLILDPDGTGSCAGTDIFWGTLLPYWGELEGVTSADCFVLFDSYLGGMTFADGAVKVDTGTGEETVFAPAAATEAPVADEPIDGPVDMPADEPAAPDADVPEPAMMTVISPAFDISLSLPTDRWTVTETEAGLLIAQQRNPIQYAFLSVALEKEPNVATLDAYADLVWTDVLMGAGVAYDAEDTVRADHPVGEAAGRTAATEWTADGAAILGDAVLWYANGRLYVALCASNEDSRAEALAILDDALLTIRTAEEAAPSVQLPVEKEVYDQIRELPPVAPVTEKVYYGYRITSGGQTYDLVPVMALMGMDAMPISLTLRSDGTGRVVLMEEEDAMTFTWTEEAFIVDEESIPYTREGDHIVLTMDGESIEFAPAAEIEAALAELNNGEKKDDSIIPTAEDLVGSWAFTKARVMGMEVSAADAGTEMSLVLNEDGSAIVLADGSPLEYEWTIREDGKVALNQADSDEFLLSFNGKELKLLVGVEGMEMIFEKEN